MKEIDKIILIANCIKKIESDKELGNIDGVIESLESYRDNVGDVNKPRVYSFLYFVRDCVGNTVGGTGKIRLRGLTENMVTDFEKQVVCKLRHEDRDFRLAGYVIDTDDIIYDYIYQIESYPVTHQLEVALYRAGFEKYKNVSSFCNDNTIRCRDFYYQG